MTTYYNYLGQPMPVGAAPTTQIYGTGQAGQTIYAPAGDSSVDTEGGANDVIVGSNGDQTYYLKVPSDTVQLAAGLTGVKNIVTYQYGVLPAGATNLTFQGATNWGIGNSGANLIIMAGNDQNYMDGGGGNDVLVGGFGQNNFGFDAGTGSNDVFYNFHANQDTVRITGASFTSFSQIQAAMTQVGPDVVLQVDSSDTITFRGVQISSFTPANFLLPLDTSKLGALTFDDEFNSLQLYNASTGKGWQTNLGGDPAQLATYQIPSNQEEQVYTNANFTGTGSQPLGYNPFSVSNGVLSITAQSFSYAASQEAWGQDYSSGMLSSRNVFAQQYGYFEMRAELPAGAGTWPAFWLSQNPFHTGVEADILEHLGSYPNTMFERANDAGVVTGNSYYMPNTSGFHTYGMLWTPTTTTFYVDDIAVMQMATPVSWNQPMYMIIDLAMGGWGGPVDNSALPASLQIDYIRVYGLADNSQVVVNGTPSGAPSTALDNGMETATYAGDLAQYSVSVSAGTVTVVDSVSGRDGTTTLPTSEQARFADYTLVFDLTSSQDKLVYELYQAAFDRTPDNAGFRYWADFADNTGASAIKLADQFLAAAEFTQKYGSNLSNSQYVTELYTNVLGRAPDQAGLNYWIGEANAGMAHDQLLVAFATSGENVQLIGAHLTPGYWTTN